jgi:hypothetical protein
MRAATAGGAAADSELVLSVTVMEHDAALKFSFHKHVLSLYSFEMPMLDSATASDLNDRLQEFYTMAFGNYHESVQAGLDVSTWSEGETAIQLVSRRVGKTYQLSWEFRKPSRLRRPA